MEGIVTRSLSLSSKLLTNPFKTGSACAVVYKATFSCCKKFFGETGTAIEERIKEDQEDVNNDKGIANLTGLSQHLRESRHTPNWK